MCNQGQTGQLSLHTRVPYLLQSSYLKMMIHYKFRGKCFSCQTQTCWLKERCWFWESRKKLGVTFLTSRCTYNVAKSVRADWLQWYMESFWYKSFWKQFPTKVQVKRLNDLLLAEGSNHWFWSISEDFLCFSLIRWSFQLVFARLLSRDAKVWVSNYQVPVGVC